MSPVALYFADIGTWLATQEGASAVRAYAESMKRRDRAASLEDTRQDVIELYVVARASGATHAAALGEVGKTMTARAKEFVAGSHQKVLSVEGRWDWGALKRYQPGDDLQYLLRDRLTVDEMEVDRLERELADLNAQAAAHPATQSHAVQWLLARPGHRIEDAARALGVSHQAVSRAVNTALQRIAAGARPRGCGRPRKTTGEVTA